MTTFEELLRRQCGAVSRQQCLAHGHTPDAIEWRLTRGTWRRAHPGAYVTYTGPLDPRTRCWAASLAAGEGTALSHGTAAWLWDLGAWCEPVRLSVPNRRRPAPLEGVRVLRARRFDPVVHGATRLTCTSPADTVLDLVHEAASLEAVLALVSGAVQQRATTVPRLRDASALRRRLRWRAELEAVLADVSAGAQSPLELAYLRKVERAHGLPEGRRQQSTRVDGRRAETDVLYDPYSLVVELDGRFGHSDAQGRWRDMHRDNAAAEGGRAALRYGWPDVLGRSCEVARQVAVVLRGRGWDAGLRRCSPACLLPRQ